MSASSLPWACGPALSPERHARLVRRAIFDCCKWHTHVDDRPVWCPFPLVMRAEAWAEAATLAEALAAEALAAEAELLTHPDLLARLRLAAPLLRAFGNPPTPGVARVMRFDFHWTADGWRISEGNIDAAGGFNEASGVTSLMADEYPDCAPAGDPAGALADAVSRVAGRGARVGLMHLTVYVEDRQVMLYLAARLRERGLTPVLFAPAQLRWAKGVAAVQSDADAGPLDVVVRFFPTEWLPRLPTATGWRHFVAGGRTPCCNPGYAILTQCKRFPLTWDALREPLPTWRALLPETRSPVDLDGDERDWVFKPTFGHEGRDVGISGVSDDWARITRAARESPDDWIVQRRFDTLPLPSPAGTLYPCLGMYVIDGRAAGAYGRLATKPLTDGHSLEAAVLVERGPQ